MPDSCVLVASDPEAESFSGPLRGACLGESGAFAGELYHEFGPSAHGGFVVAKRLEDEAACCVFAEPVGRGSQATLLGAYLKGAVASLLNGGSTSGGSPRGLASAPCAALVRIDKTLETALYDLGIPGAMVAMSAVIASARDGRVTVLCRGTGGVAMIHSDGSPVWINGGGAPLFGVMLPGFLPGPATSKLRTYALAPGDTVVLVNGQFDDVPGLDSITAKGFVPILGARALRGGRLPAGEVTLALPPPNTESPTAPERMALALHALRLAGLARAAAEPRLDLVLDSEQVAYFERVCKASGIVLPKPEATSAARKTYTGAAPRNAKPPLAFLLHRAH